MAELKPAKEIPAKGKLDCKVGYLKMKVMEDLIKAANINKVVKESVKPDTIAQSDGYRGYNKPKEILWGTYSNYRI